MKHIISISMIAFALSSVAASAAPTVSFTPGSGVLPANVNVIENFDEYAAGSTIGTGTLALNSSSGLGATPAFGSTGNYASVTGGGTYSIAFAPTSTLAFVLGSLDAYNSLKLFFADNTSEELDGSGIIGVTPPPYADGNQQAAYTNGAVSYSVGAGPKIVGALFKSSANSFEFDNIATATGTPEPASWGMMILGMGAVGAALRKRRSTAPALAAA